MALQQIINLSNQIIIDRHKMVGVQYSRSQLPKTDLTPTKNPWRFTISAAAQPWDLMRSTIEGLNTLDRYQPETISFANNPNMSWLFRYQGDYAVTPTGITVSSFVGNQLVLSKLPTMSSTGYLFRAGDFIQVSGYPFPFTSTTDVVRGSGSTVTVTTHRPNILTASIVGVEVIVGSSVQFSVFCPNLPNYKISPGAFRRTGAGIVNNAIVEWEDSFQLYEFVSGA